MQCRGQLRKAISALYLTAAEYFSGGCYVIRHSPVLDLFLPTFDPYFVNMHIYVAIVLFILQLHILAAAFSVSKYEGSEARWDMARGPRPTASLESEPTRLASV